MAYQQYYSRPGENEKAHSTNVYPSYPTPQQYEPYQNPFEDQGPPQHEYPQPSQRLRDYYPEAHPSPGEDYSMRVLSPHNEIDPNSIPELPHIPHPPPPVPPHIPQNPHHSLASTASGTTAASNTDFNEADTLRGSLDPSYPMKTLPNSEVPFAQSPSIISYGNKHAGYHRFSDDDFENVKQQRKREFLGRCCGCCPLWLRIVGCTCLVLLIALIIIAGALVGTFKQPIIKFEGVGTHPDGLSVYQPQANKAFTINVGLNVSVVNNNIFGPYFSMIKADAYYPVPAAFAQESGSDPKGVYVGGGNKSDVYFGPHSTTTIIFPLSITYNPTMKNSQAILADITKKCSLTGSAKEKLNINYDLTLYLRILFVSIAPRLSESASFDCPLKNGQIPGASEIINQFTGNGQR
ncbi:uncharacterized protein VTP21DRAFT_9749 [Calcarisporiella thermophila]|uniref:uncharacterized protein n=1 Tax=Calcarisporiella thermophila TaxID=911321 RepID=UPI00374464D7